MSAASRFNPGLACVALGLALAGPALAQAPVAAAGPASAASAAPLESLKDKMNYATGVMTARTMSKNGAAVDIDMIVQGLRDGQQDGPVRMSEKELKLVLQSMSAEIQRKLSNERMVKAGVARENGRLFQIDYAKKPGVTVLPGGLMVRSITEGTGDKPTELSKVVVRYRGTLIDGTEFDATPKGKTATLKPSDTITGFREALKRMPAGSTWELVIPPTLAYGTRGNDSLGPNETLVFTVELVAVVQ